jgi:hypothetical protein
MAFGSSLGLPVHPAEFGLASLQNYMVNSFFISSHTQISHLWTQMDLCPKKTIYHKLNTLQIKNTFNTPAQWTVMD